MPLWLLAHANVTWYLIPLAMVISLVYSASRYELSEQILRRAIRLFMMIVGLMVGVLIILWLLSLNL